jgi:pimeloyl-ACP methyl ester carboxylesterase
MESISPLTEELDNAKFKFIDVDGISTRYYEAGAGDPLFLFSGGQFGLPFVYSLDTWSLNIPGLAKHFHVYAVDKLGQGYTDNPKVDSDYTFEAVVQHAYGLIQALGISKCYVVGHSRGGLLGARLALEHPELVKRLVIVDSASLAPESSIFPSGDWYSMLPLQSGPPTLESVKIEPYYQAYEKAQVTHDFASRLLKIASRPQYQESQDKMETLGPGQFSPSINRIRERTIVEIDKKGFSMPTLLIWGFNDRSAPLPLGHHLFEHIVRNTPDAEMHILNGGGHNSYRDQPELFNRTIKGFFAE